MRIKKSGFLTKIIILALLIYMATALLDLQGQLQTNREQEELLTTQIEAQTQENAQLNDAIENCDDPEVLEAVARDKGYVMPGDTLYVDTAN